MEPLDWRGLLLHNLPASFLGEVALRSAIIFVVVLATLKISGKRGVRQLSIFELVIILTLGSAAGDVSLYHDVPLLPALVVFVSTILLYRLTTWLVERNPWLERLLEGTPLIIIRDGAFVAHVLERENISFDEFLMELRLRGVEHLGQVRLAILEVCGGISVYFYEPQDVRPGLPITPDRKAEATEVAHSSALHACNQCGLLQPLQQGQSQSCPSCSHRLWVRAIDTRPAHDAAWASERMSRTGVQSPPPGEDRA